MLLYSPPPGTIPSLATRRREKITKPRVSRGASLLAFAIESVQKLNSHAPFCDSSGLKGIL
jgi:hypothetical protein